jgi:hypothetical protein
MEMYLEVLWLGYIPNSKWNITLVQEKKLKKVKKKLDTYRFLLVYLGINNE